MAEYHIATEWKEGLAFDALIDEFSVRMDSPSAEGMGTGPSPKKLVLAGLLGCTGMDVASLLKKMRVPFTEFRVEGDAPITAEHPKTFERVHMRYIVTGSNINREKVEKAVQLSQERYCGVSVMLSKHCPIDWEIIVNEEAAATKEELSAVH